MTQQTAKIRIKIGTMEVDYEGDSSFLDGGIEKLLETMAGMAHNNFVENQVAAPPAPALQVDASNNEANNWNLEQPPLVGSPSFSTSMLASHADAETSADLILCAMAFLELNAKQNPNSSKEIFAEMKNVSTVYNSMMSTNNTKNLRSLAKSKKINEVSSGKFSLGKEERQKFEAIIAEFD